MTSLAELRERLKLCTDDVKERPYSHPVATGRYAEDVPALLDVAEAAKEWNRILGAEFSTNVEWSHARQKLSIALARLEGKDE